MPTLQELPPWFFPLFGTLLGLFGGSFLNVVIHRLPREQNIAFPSSTCPHCGKRIAAYDNIPLLSYVILRGRARCCKAPISVRYPSVELIGGLFAWALCQLLAFNLPGSTSLGELALIFGLDLIFGLGLVAIAFIDLEYMIVPDEISLGGALLGVATAAFRPQISIVDSLLGAAVGFIIVWLPFDVLYRKLRGQPGMGLGDAKLLLFAGAWLGVQAPVFALLAGAVQGTLAAIVIYLVKGKIEEPEAVTRERAELREQLEKASPTERAELERELALDPLALTPPSGIGKVAIAFGPFLALATLEYLLLGDFLLNWVLGKDT